MKADTNRKSPPITLLGSTNLKPQEGNLNQFPNWIMSGIAGNFARLYSEHLESPLHHFYMAFLTCLGSVLADRLTLATEIAPQPRLFTLILGESADDRKSTTLSKTIDFFKDAVSNFPICWGVGSAEGLQARLKKDGRLLLAVDEFAQFVGKTKIKASVLLPCVTTLYESNRYENQTKNTEVIIDQAHLSILAASTLDTYETIFDSRFMDIGFVNRLFIVPGSSQRRFSLPPKIPISEIEKLKKMLAQVMNLATLNPELELSSKARKRYQEWYISQTPSIHTKRLDTYALRFMALLAINDLKTKVNEETIAKVCALCDWQLAVRQIHDPIDAETIVAKMEEKIRRQVRKRGPINERDLQRHVNAHRVGLWVYGAALKNLKQFGEVKEDPKSKALSLCDQVSSTLSSLPKTS